MLYVSTGSNLDLQVNNRLIGNIDSFQIPQKGLTVVNIDDPALIRLFFANIDEIDPNDTILCI